MLSLLPFLHLARVSCVITHPHSTEQSQLKKIRRRKTKETTGELGFSNMKKRQQVGARRSERSSDNGMITNTSSSSSCTVMNVRYGECQKNHAANIGGYAVDGCREFMASGEEGTAAALRCAACTCHRNFHRREVDYEVVCECPSPSSNGR